MKYKVIFTFHEGIDKNFKAFDCDNQTEIRYILNQACIRTQDLDSSCNFYIYNENDEMIERGTIEQGVIIEHFVKKL